MSSQSILLSNRRFASTESTTPTSPAAQPTPSPELSPETDFSSFSDFDAPSLLNIPERVGYLANLGLDYGHGPTSLCQWTLEHLHFTAGLGWFGAIIGAALAIRVVMAYPALLAQLESTKSQEMRKDPVYQDRQQKFMVAMANGGKDPAEMMQLRMQLKYIQAQYGVKPSRMALPMLQLPLAYGMFKLTSGMSKLPVPGLENAGVLWFTDLTVPDPLYILPCIGSVIMYISIKVRYCYIQLILVFHKQGTGNADPSIHKAYPTIHGSRASLIYEIRTMDSRSDRFLDNTQLPRRRTGILRLCRHHAVLPDHALARPHRAPGLWAPDARVDHYQPRVSEAASESLCQQARCISGASDGRHDGDRAVEACGGGGGGGRGKEGIQESLCHVPRCE